MTSILLRERSRTWGGEAVETGSDSCEQPQGKVGRESPEAEVVKARTFPPAPPLSPFPPREGAEPG